MKKRKIILNYNQEYPKISIDWKKREIVILKFIKDVYLDYETKVCIVGSEFLEKRIKIF